ncbi:MAG: YceI family protein [Proteobacteria bacterium]|uniref:YceI family protein n=1 Tax=Rudaea sp. TaxID=2136325 RepID=UPI001D861E5E|nr:YceI family protein [Pseudomonadota bacterium]MBS0568825.1 YceI family protein [Pseudomonadota bacterium]
MTTSPTPAPRRRRMVAVHAALAGLLLGLVAAAGAAERFQYLALDPTRSHVDFEVKVLWLVGVHGRFGSVRGMITIDHFRNAATVEAQIDARIVAMRNRNHEQWVKSAEFFDAAHYPQITFVSDAIPLQRLQAGGDVDGVLTLRGMSKRVRFELVKPDCPAASGDDCPVEAQGSIRRSDFGMSSRRGTLSDKVELSFSIATRPMPGDRQP